MNSAERIDLGAPDEVVWIVSTLEKAGFVAWAVGGAVRDALRGEIPEDWDLTTSATPRDVQRIFRRTAPIGIDYGTVGVIARSGRMYEVTTFRRDVETFGRRARVAFSTSLEEDLARRDFTINAIAWHPLTKELRDPHSGRSDLEAGVLRTVGEAERRFEEDRLRALRALRFAGRFDLRIEDGTWKAVVDSADRLDRLSPERVREELWRILTAQPRPATALELYAASGVLRALYPELEACRGLATGDGEDDVWHVLLRAVDAASRRRPLVRLAALLHASALPELRLEGDERPTEAEAAARSAAIARELLKRLRFSNAEVDTVTHLVAQQAPVPAASAPDPEIRRWLQRVGPEHVEDLVRLLLAVRRARNGGGGEGGRDLVRLRSRARAVIRSGVPLSVTQLAVGGGELRSLGIPPGPVYGAILRELLERVTDDPGIDQRKALAEIARAHAG